MDDQVAPIGPGAAPAAPINVAGLLDGASEFEYVTVLNPFTVPFAVRVGQDVPVNMPFSIGKDTSGKVQQVTNTERDAQQMYGLSLRNPDFQGRKHIMNDTIIQPGKTINLKGSEAQVAVRQIVNEMLQRKGQSRLSADPNVRREAEEEIVIYRGSIQELMDSGLQSQRQQMDAAINQSNNEVLHGRQSEAPAFDGSGQTVSEQTTGAPDAGGQSDGKTKRLGRSKGTVGQADR